MRKLYYMTVGGSFGFKSWDLFNTWPSMGGIRVPPPPVHSFQKHMEVLRRGWGMQGVMRELYWAV